MELSFILYLNSLKQFVHWKTVSEIFRSIPQIPFREYVFESSFNLDIFTEDFTSENEGIQREKLHWNSSFDERPDLHARLHQKNEQTPSTSKDRFT